GCSSGGVGVKSDCSGESAPCGSRPWDGFGGISATPAPTIWEANCRECNLGKRAEATTREGGSLWDLRHSPVSGGVARVAPGSVNDFRARDGSESPGSRPRQVRFVPMRHAEGSL